MKQNQKNNMVENISERVQTARKDYHDDSAEFIQEALDWLAFHALPNELAAIHELKENNWMIKKGQIYLKQWNKQDGETFTYRTLPSMSKICQKYNLWEDC